MAVPAPTGYTYTPPNGQWTHQPPPAANPTVGPVPSPVLHSAEDTKLNKLWSFQTKLGLLGTIYDFTEAQFPTFTHTIAVSVIGGPKSDMRRIWQLCLSTAFGRYRQGGRTGIQAGHLEATWDITSKSCQVVIGYVNSGIEGAISGAGSLAATAILNPAGALLAGGIQAIAGPTTGDFLYQGPTQETVGGDTLSWLNADGVYANTAVVGAAGGGVGAVLGGLLFKSASAAKTGAKIGTVVGTVVGAIQGRLIDSIKNRPALPDSNRVITTANKVNPNIQPPKPSGDGVSRTFPYLALVANALNSPCYLPASPPKGAQLDVTTPVYYGGPSKPYDKANINNTVNGYIVNIPVNTDAVIGAAGGLIAGIQVISKDRKDGYPVMPDKTIDNLQGPTNPGTQ